MGEAIGRGESVLVICQKQAALQVVQKRLDAEGLAERLFAVTDVNRDREAIVRALRDQLPAARGTDSDVLVSLRRRREAKAGRVEALEGEIDRRHTALHASGGDGLSYRSVLGGLIGVEAGGLVIEAPRLRTVLGSMDVASLSALEETCGPLAGLWLASSYENNPLSALLPFAVDAGVATTVAEDMATFVEAEVARAASLDASDNLETDDAEAVISWLHKVEPVLGSMDPQTRAHLADWLPLFDPPAAPNSPGAGLMSQLAEVVASIDVPRTGKHDTVVAAKFAELEDQELRRCLADLEAYALRPGFFGRLGSTWKALVKRIATFARDMGGEPLPETLSRLEAAARTELALRPHRRALAGARSALRLTAAERALQGPEVLAAARSLSALLKDVRDGAACVRTCPCPAVAVAAVEIRTREGWQDFVARVARACARHRLRASSRAALEPLAEWFPGSWLAGCSRRIQEREPTSSLTGPILDRLPCLMPYQRFRARVPGLSPEAVRAFAALRQLEGQLASVAQTELDGVVRRTLRREALLCAKGRLETDYPELLYGREELEARVKALATLDGEMRDLNREALSRGTDAARLGTPAAWDDLTRLAGPRKRRLRELLDSGPELGLMHLRPVWLMNPDVASRVLPLRAGMFDLVIFDEASQMPVEHAVPALYRARRAVVSGDEKQMPPSSYFAGNVEDDEDAAEDVDLDDAVTEAERLSLEEGWDRREVKDCPDLLQLARTVLGTATLQIHYRSNYRELIGFSNAAYYGGSLSIPARQPEAEVRRSRPLEVVRVDGVYASQTNPEEAERVVDVLERLWSVPETHRPSVGVVTFNRRQADLVETALANRGQVDPDFMAQLRRERDRRQDGEDMGFFVKNVENVQGDERDVIVFSTTFGRDARGAFRRHFGVLGKTGGERRLNVAVTRARDKVVLVTSIPVNGVSDWLASGRSASKPRDYLQAYLDYASKVDAGALDLAGSLTDRLTGRRQRTSHRGQVQDESDGFVKSVAEFIRSLGHEPVRADDAGDAFGLDFAVVDPCTALFGIGIECDSPRHPLLSRARAREIWRPAVLRRAVPAVHRVSSFDWYQRPQAERARLRHAVENAVGSGRSR